MNNTVEKNNIEKLVEMITSGCEEQAIDMINESRMASKGVPNAEDLAMMPDNIGVTALMWSLFCERDALIKLLLPISNLAALSHDNISVVGYACLSGNTDYIAMVYALMEKETINRNLFFVKNSTGNHPIDYLLEHMECLKNHIKFLDKTEKEEKQRTNLKIAEEIEIARVAIADKEKAEVDKEATEALLNKVTKAKETAEKRLKNLKKQIEKKQEKKK